MKSFPLVEAVDDRPWVVRNGQGSVDVEKRVMLVPLGSSGADRHVRAHEMAHVKISPRLAVHKQCKKFGVTVDALQVCEDHRVHSYLQHCEVPSAAVLTQPEADAWMLKADMRGKAAFLVASFFTADFELGLNALRKQLPGSVIDELISNVQVISNRLHAGRKIYRPIGMRNCTIPAARLFDALWPEDADEGLGKGDIPIKDLGGREMRGGRSVPWGKLKVNKIPASSMRPVPRCGQKKVYHDEGAVLSAPYRLPVDGRVFVRKMRSLGGTVLLDTSGSMKLSERDLHEILRAAPAATVAIYSGRSKSGTLTVVGENGRLAPMPSISAAASNAGGGNVVDGPALKWLTDQPGPRIWVSDGVVTGVGDAICTDLGVDAENICRRGGIRRVAKASAVTEFLRQSRPR